MSLISASMFLNVAKLPAAGQRLPGKPMSATLSLGIAAFPDHGDNARELLLRADQALYQAKLQGRNQVVAADAPDGLAPMASQAG